MKSTLLSVAFFALAASGVASGGRTPIGARSLAMGGTSVALSDLWSAGNNQAGMAWLKGFCAGIGMENHFLLKELNREQFALCLPMKTGSFGLVLTNFGNSAYGEIKAGFSYARKLGRNFAAALQLDYLRIHQCSDYGNRNLASCEIGLMYRAGSRLTLGLQLVNPVPVRITRHPPETLPAVMCFGMTWRFSDNFLLSAEAEKDLEHPLRIRTGAEYRVAKPAHARIGFATAPLILTFGFGLQFGRFTVDAASGYHQALGFSPALTICYGLN